MVRTIVCEYFWEFHPNMNQRCHNSIIFVFDTNAFSYLADNERFDEILGKLHNQNNTLFPLFSLINFYEYLKGIKDDSILYQRQRYIKAIKKITMGGSIFINPVSHVQYFSDQISRDEAKSEADFFIKMINLFISLRNYADYRKSFQQLLRDVNSRIAEIVSGYRAMKESTIRIKRDYSTKGLKRIFKNRFNKAPLAEDYETLFRNLCSRFKLNIISNGENIVTKLASYPSVLYFIDVYWKYVAQLIFDNRNPDWGDYFDLEQMVYLNIADYLITNENRVRLWINENHNPDLKGRAKSPGEFVALLDSAIIQKKAKTTDFYLETQPL